jgi:nitrogen regulatory protein P-II 2
VKLIVAMVRQERIEQVLRELYMNEIYLKTISLCTAYDGRDDERPTRGSGDAAASAPAEGRPMYRLEIAVNDVFVRPTMNALLAGAHTGQPGDGKILILPLDEVVRIRNGDTGTHAIG